MKKTLKRFVSVAVSAAILVTSVYMPGLTRHVDAAENITASQLKSLLNECSASTDGFNLKLVMEDSSQWKNISISKGESNRFYTDDSANYLDVSISDDNLVTCIPSYYYKSWAYQMEEDEIISALVSIDVNGHSNGLALITNKGRLISEATCISSYKMAEVDEAEFAAEYPDATFTDLQPFDENPVQNITDLFSGPIYGYIDIVIAQLTENNYSVVMDERARLSLAEGEIPLAAFANESDETELYLKTSAGNIYKFGTDSQNYATTVYRDITVNGMYPDAVLDSYYYMATYSGELYAQGDAVSDYEPADSLCKASDYGYGRYKTNTGVTITVQNNKFSRPISYGDSDVRDIASEDTQLVDITTSPLQGLSKDNEYYIYKTGRYTYKLGCDDIAYYFGMNGYYVNGSTYGFIDSKGVLYAKYCVAGATSNRRIDSSNVQLSNKEIGQLDKIIYVNDGELLYMTTDGKLVYKGVNDDTDLLVSLLNELEISEKSDFIMYGGVLYITFDGHMYEFTLSSNDLIDTMCHIYYENGAITGQFVKNGINVTDWNGNVYSSDFKIDVNTEGYYEFTLEDSYGHKLTKVVEVNSDNSDAKEVPTVSAVNKTVYLNGVNKILVSKDNKTWTGYDGPVEYSVPLYVKYDIVGAAVVKIIINDNGQMEVQNIEKDVDVADRLANFFYIDGDNHLSLISPKLKEYFENVELPVIDEFGVMYHYTGLNNGRMSYDMISDVTSACTRIREKGILETELDDIDSVSNNYGIKNQKKSLVYTYIDKAGNVISTDKQYFRTKEHKSEYEKITDGIKTFFINGYNYFMRANGETLKIEDEAENLASNLIELRGSIQLLNNRYAKVNGNTVEIIGSANKIINTSGSDGVSYRIDDNGVFQYKRDGMTYYENVSTDGLTGEYSKSGESVLPVETPYSANVSKMAVIKTKPNPGSYRLITTKLFDTYSDARKFAIESYGMVDNDTNVEVYASVGGVNKDKSLVFNISYGAGNGHQVKVDIYALQQRNNRGCNKYGVSLTNTEYDDMDVRVKDYVVANPTEMLHIEQYLSDLTYNQNLSDNVSFEFKDNNTYFIVDKNGENEFALGNGGVDVPISMFTADGVYADGFYIFKAESARLSNQDMENLKKIYVYSFSGVVYNKDKNNTYKKYYDIYPVFDDTLYNITNPKAYTENSAFVIERKSLNNDDGSITVNNNYTLKVDASNGEYIKLRFKNSGYGNAFVFGKEKSTGKVTEIQRFNENDMKAAASEEDSDIKYLRTSQICLDTDVYDIYVTYTSNADTENALRIYSPYVEKFTCTKGTAPKFIACRQLINNGVDTALLVDENYHVYTYSFDNSNTWTNLGTTLNFGQNNLEYALSDTSWSNKTLSLQTNTYGGKVRNVDVYDTEGNKINSTYTKGECLINTENVLSLEDGVIKSYVAGQEMPVITFLNDVCGITGASIVSVCGKESVSYNGCVYRNVYNLLENISYTGRFFESEGDDVILCMDYLSGAESNSVTLNTKCDISGNGIYQIKGMDAYGNIYSNTLDVRNIDRLAPDIKVDASNDGFKLEGVDADATSTDAQSGIAKVFYCVGECAPEDKGKPGAVYVPSVSWEEYSGEFLQYGDDDSLSKASKNTVTVDAPVIFTYCVDNAGNVSSTHAVTLSGTLNVAHDVVYENGKTTVTFNGSDPDTSAAVSDINFKYGDDKKNAPAANSFSVTYTDASLGEFEVPVYAEKLMPEGYTKKGTDVARLSVVSVGKPVISGGTGIKIADAPVINDSVDATYYRYINLADRSDFTETDSFNKYKGTIDVVPGTYKVEAYTVSADKKIKGDISSVTLKIEPNALDISDSVTYKNGSTDVSFDIVNKKNGVSYSYSYLLDGNWKSGNTYTVTSDSEVTMKAAGDDMSTGEYTDNIKVIYSGEPVVSNVKVNGNSVTITAGEIKNDSLALLEYQVDGEKWETVKSDGTVELTPGKHTIAARQTTAVHGFITESSREVFVSNLEVYGTQKHYNHKTDLFIYDKNNKDDTTIKFSYMDESKVYEQGDNTSFTKSQLVTVRDEDSYGNYNTADINVSVTDTDSPTIGELKPNGDTIKLTAGNLTNGTLKNIKFKVDTDSSYADYTGSIKLSVGKHVIYTYQEVIPTGQQDSDDIVYSDIVTKEVVVVNSKIQYTVKYHNGETELTFEDCFNPKGYTYSYTPEDEDVLDGDTFIRKSSGNVELYEEDSHGNYDRTTVYVTVVHTDAPIIGDSVDGVVNIAAGEIINDELKEITYRVDGGEWIKGSEVVLPEGTHNIEAYQTTKTYGIVSDVSQKTVTISSHKPIEVNYVVRYVDTDGNNIADEKSGKGELEQLVTESAIEIKGYIPVKDSISMILETNDNIFTFVYNRSQVKYKVKYVDLDNNELADEKVASALYGDTVREVAKTIYGYTPLRKTKELKNISDTGNNELVFVYVKKTFLYTIHYRTTDGVDLCDDKVATVKYNEEVIEYPVDIKGYSPRKSKHQFVVYKRGLEKTFIYDVNSYEYTVKYLDENNKPIHEQKSSSAEYGRTVTENSLDIEGYIPLTDKQSIIIDITENQIVFVYRKKGDDVPNDETETITSASTKQVEESQKPSSNSTQELVKTGDSSHMYFILVGMLFISALIFAFAGRKRREHSK